MKNLAKQLLARNDWVIFDTETTGLDGSAEIVQIGLLAPDGTVLMDTLVKPANGIPSDAIRIHGITNAAVADAPTIIDLEPQLKRIMQHKTIVVYNAPYDSRLLTQSFQEYYLDLPSWDVFTDAWFNQLDYIDIMEPYAEFWGEFNDYFQSYTWQKLTVACEQQGIDVVDAHSAIGDCKMTLALIQKIGVE